MKKLTSGVFATLLTVVAVGGANAEIASKTYVDDQVGTRATTASVTTLQGQVTTMGETVSDQGTRLQAAEGSIDTLEAASATHAIKTEVEAALADKQDSALIKSAQYSTNTTNDDAYPSVAAVANAITAVSGDVTGVTEDVAELQGTVTSQGERLTTAEGEIDALQTNPAVTSGITSEKVTKYDAYDAKITAAQQAADAAQDPADLKLDKATYDAQVGEVSAVNMGTTASTVVTAINEVSGKITTASGDATQAKADAAQAKTDAASALAEAGEATEAATAATEAATTASQTATAASQTATEAKNTADTASQTATEAKNTALAAIPKPTDPNCDNPTNKCVLTYNNSVYEWEVVAR